MNGSSNRFLPLAAAVVVAFMAGMFFVSAGADVLDGSGTLIADSNAATADSDLVVKAPLLELEDAFADVAEYINPAVVQIAANRYVDQPNMQGLFDRFELFRRGMPGQDRDQEDDSPSENRRLAPALGSGVVIRDDGYIITNNHVIDKSEDIEVRMFDGSEHPAELVGVDEQSDLAVLKIDLEKELPRVPYGDIDDVRVGQWVLAFGSPMTASLSNSVTAGIVSALGRWGGNQIENYIQTDAAINPGNSGGPLVNLRGELIGINTMIYSRTGGSDGIGLSIPVSTVRNIVDQIIQNGSVSRGYLGVQFQPLTETLAEALNVPRTAAQVAMVVEDGAAEKAGIKADDVIVSVNGVKLANHAQLRSDIGASKPGDTVELGIVRKGKELTIKAVLGTPPTDGEEVAEESRRPTESAEVDLKEDLGISIRTLTDEMVSNLRLDEDVEGILVSRVAEDSKAYQDAEIRRNDIIFEFDAKAVASVADFEKMYKDLESGSPFILRVRRGPNTFRTALKKP